MPGALGPPGAIGKPGFPGKQGPSGAPGQHGADAQVMGSIMNLKRNSNFSIVLALHVQLLLKQRSVFRKKYFFFNYILKPNKFMFYKHF